MKKLDPRETRGPILPNQYQRTFLYIPDSLISRTENNKNCYPFEPRFSIFTLAGVDYGKKHLTITVDADDNRNLRTRATWLLIVRNALLQPHNSPVIAGGFFTWNGFQ